MSDFITNAELRIEAERLCDENERLKAENDKLRNDADLLRAMWEQARLEAQGFKAENAKLRELVVTLMACLSVDDCDKCPINGAEFKVSEVRCCYAAKQRMRDLGVEVSE